MRTISLLRACLRTSPVRGPGLQEAVIPVGSCRPRALTRRAWGVFKQALRFQWFGFRVSDFGFRIRRRLALALALLLPAASALAYPPAPYHTLYGLLRDQYGTPILSSDVHVVLVTSNGVAFDTQVTPGIGPGVNYELKVNMDAGLTPITYKPTAYIVAAPFKLYVVMGGVTNIPFQMAGDFSHLGQPSLSTRFDLTLGADANTDNIPDAWELFVIYGLGLNLTLNQVNGNSVLTGDGLTLMQQYVLGVNPLASPSALTVTLVDYHAGTPLLQFRTATGRSYTVQGSQDLLNWTSRPFTIPPSTSTNSFYTATSEQTVQVQVILPSPNPKTQFFRIQVQ